MPALRIIYLNRWLALVLLAVALTVQAETFREVRVTLTPEQALPAESTHLRITARNGEILTISADAIGRSWLQIQGYTVESIPAVRQASGYPSFGDLEDQMNGWLTQYPENCRRYSIGQSVNGHNLWVMEISDHSGTVDPLEPQLRITATPHGDEAIAMEMARRLVLDLLNGAKNGQQPEARLVAESDIHILLVMNPDGYIANTRENANYKDLNRNFPAPYVRTDGWTEASIQPETQAIMDWTASHRFVLSAGLHSGSVGIVYPWGHHHDYLDPVAQFPETELAREVCTAFTTVNPYMYAHNGGGWDHGMINGAQWYPVEGEMADWQYRYHGCLETTIEFSSEFIDTKAPDYSTMDLYWDYPAGGRQNRQALLHYLAYGHRGVRGLLRDATTGVSFPAAVHLGIAPDDSAPRQFTAPALAAGWNLVSLPLPAAANGVQDIFPSSTSAVFYDPEQHSYLPVTTLQPGRGYWVDNSSHLTTIRPGLATSGNAVTSLNLTVGWQLIGPPWDTTVSFSGSSPLVLVSWDAATSEQRRQYHYLDPDAILKAGRGYWAFAREAGTLTFLTTRPPKENEWPGYATGDPDTGNPPAVRRAGTDGETGTTGDYFRLLRPGNRSIWIEDLTTPALTHTPPVAAVVDVPISLVVDAVAPHAPASVYLLDIPGDWDSDGMPRYLRADLNLPAPAIAVHLFSCQNAGGDWLDTNMTASGGGGSFQAEPVPTQTGTFDYYFELRAADGTILVRLPETDFFSLPVTAPARAVVEGGRSAPTSAADRTRGASSLSGWFQRAGNGLNAPVAVTSGSTPSR